MIEKSDLLAALEEEAGRAGRTGFRVPGGTDTPGILKRYKEAIAAALDGVGEINDSAAFDELCATVQVAIQKVEEPGDVPTSVSRHVTKARLRVRTAMRVKERWERPRMFQGSDLTDHGLEALNKARDAMGIVPVVREGNEFFTLQELEAYRAIARELGETAVAEFLCALHPEKFAFNNRTIENLRKWLGDIETYRGTAIEDIPVKLLTLPELSCLRQLLFNRTRDKYFAQYKDGLPAVIGALQASHDKAAEEPRREFIREVMDYFRAVDAIRCPDRMREVIGEGAEFPGKHQKVAIAEIKRQRQLLLADEMGGGKTGSAIAAFEHLREEGLATRCLVMCPSEVVGEWAKRLSSRAQGYFKDEKGPKVVIIRSGDEDRAETWKQAKEADYVVMSIDMARSSTGGVSHEELARGLNADFFVVDEAHNVKSPDGEDTERVYRISQCDSIKNGYTVLLSGTPVPNKIGDVAAHLRLLNAGQARANASTESGGGGGVDFGNLRELTKAISKNHTRMVRNLLLLRMLHRSTEECLPVGTRLDIEPPRYAKLSAFEQAYYDAIFEDPFLTATQKIQLFSRVCLHREAMKGAWRTGETKERELRESIDEFVGELETKPDAHSGKIVIASSGVARGVTRDFQDRNDPETSDNCRYIAGRIREDYEKKGVKVFILDGVNTGTRHLREGGELAYDIDGAPMTPTRRIIKEFREHEGPAVLFTRTDVIGEGIDLSFASRGILLAPTDTLAERNQFIRRMYRRGQKKHVILRTLVTADSIERGRLEYAEEKQRIIWDLLNGRPLTKAEEDILDDDTTKVKRGGILAFETLTPRQKVMWIFHRMLNKSKEAIREFFASKDGAYAKILAQLYHEDWDTTFAGNNARMVTGLVQDHLEGLKTELGVDRLQMADIAAGGLTMARMLQHRDDVDVHSSDICGPMLEAGRSLLKTPVPDDRIATCAMDELPYKDGSMHLAVHSLALQYSRHHMRADGGRERVKALSELNRVLVPGGLAFLSLPPHLITDEKKFSEICRVLRTFFGFEVMARSGRAVSIDQEDEEEFVSYVFTLKKIGEPCVDGMQIDDWKALAFSKKDLTAAGTGPREREPQPLRTQPPPPGSYHEAFTVGEEIVAFETRAPEHAEARETHRREKKEYQTAVSRIEELIKEFGSIRRIPAEKLLSLTLEEVDGGAQSLKDEYFRHLLERHGSIDAVPFEEISAHSSVILLRGQTKKGSFICLGYLDGRKKAGYGKRYFYQQEFEDAPPEAETPEPAAGTSDGDEDPPRRRKKPRRRTRPEHS